MLGYEKLIIRVYKYFGSDEVFKIRVSFFLEILKKGNELILMEEYSYEK